jgi:hypothetical protein
MGRMKDEGHASPHQPFSLVVRVGLPLSPTRTPWTLLVLKASSLERAETRLRESGMLDTVTDEELTINPAKIEGLRVRLVQ